MQRRVALALLLAALATLAAFWLDPFIYRQIRYPEVDRHDWGRMLRVTGSLVFWIPLAAALWLEARVRDPGQSRKAWLIALGPAVAGLGAEFLKLVIRRERPSLHDGAYVYRSFAERPLDSHDLGFPSSHVVVAFGGAAMLARQYPRAGWVAYALAVGCAATRVLTQAHFLSDVVGGGLAGWAIATWMARRFPLTRPSN